MRIVIVMDGGIIHEVIADDSDVDVVLLDKDLDGFNEDEIREINGERCLVSRPFIEVSPEIVDATFTQVDDEDSDDE